MSEDILKMLDAIQNKSYNDANEIFNDLIGQKLDQALEQEKVQVAATVYGDDSEEEEEVDIPLEDDDIELVADDEEEFQESETEDEDV